MGTGVSSRTLADLLLCGRGVACLSGTLFGRSQNIEAALGRIRTLSERWTGSTTVSRIDCGV